MVKWIKITTDIFDDEKIKIIDTLPARDEILVVWFKLLALAGKTNQNGLLFMSNKIAYTPDMLAAIFNRELNTIKLALATFENFGMIEVEENQVISIANWEKHQNIDGMDKIRLDGAKRQAKYREKKKIKQLEMNSDVISDVTVTDGNALEEEKEKEKKKKENKETIESIWLAYPIKKGKASAIKKIPKLLKEYSVDELLNAIKRYDKSVTDKNYLMHGSTFFNGGYMDYIGPEETTVTKTHVNNYDDVPDFVKDGWD